MIRFRLAVLFSASCIGVAAACDDATAGRTVLRVYGASSLTESFREMEMAFEARHPAVDVQLTIAGSQVLRLQIEQGAPADVFASADPAHVRSLREAGRIGEGVPFALNHLVLIVPVGNPAGLTSFGDLPKAERIVLGAQNVPVGRYARDALRAMDRKTASNFGLEVMRRVVSEEANARLVRAKVEVGEADAALVYETDAEASRGVRVIPLPEDVNAEAVYFIAEVGVPPSALASQWIELVLSPEGSAILRAHGFGAP